MLFQCNKFVFSPKKIVVRNGLKPYNISRIVEIKNIKTGMHDLNICENYNPSITPVVCQTDTISGE